MTSMKRTISVLLVLLLVLSLLPASVFAAPAAAKTGVKSIDFTTEDDADKYEIVGQDRSEVEEGVGLALFCTQGGPEPAKRDVAEADIDAVKVPISGDWTATLEVEFNKNAAANGYYQFFGFFASEGGDNQNLVGIRGGDGAMQDFIRKDGAITEETQSSTPGFDTDDKTYFLRIEKEGTTYTCYRSDDGEDFTQMFDYADCEIEADEIIIDAYTGQTANYKFTLKGLEFEGVEEDEAAWTLASEIEAGKTYVIVADGKYAMNNVASDVGGNYRDQGQSLGATEVTIEGDKITSEVPDSIKWNIEDAEGAPDARDGADCFFLFDQAGGQLLRRSGYTGTAPLSVGTMDPNNQQYAMISFYERTDGSYAVYTNSNKSTDYNFTLSGREAGFDAPGVAQANWDGETYGSSIRLYTLVGGSEVKLDKKPLRTAIREANNVARRYYTEESLAVLDEALAAAKLALDTATTQAELDAATKTLNDAIAGLERSPNLPKYKVTFDYNYPGAPEAVVVEVEEGMTVEAIEAPARVGYRFNYWGTESSSGGWWGGTTISRYNFSTPITADITLKGSWSKDWNQMYSLAEEYEDYFAFGNFGTQSPNGDQVTREYNTYSGNSGKMTYNFGANESRNAYNQAVAAINADDSLSAEEKAQKIKEADGVVLLGSNNPLANDLNRIQQWNEQHPEGPKKYYRQHVLFWHGSEQNPAFYHEGFDTSKPLVTPEVMNLRIDSYVEAMFKRYQPWDDIILSWDVVNEALDDYNGMVRNGWNGSSWGETNLDDASNQSSAWGTIYRHKELDDKPQERLQAEAEWIRVAFASARKWQKELGVHWKLYYNDYMNSSMLYEPKMTNTLNVLKPIYEAGNIDGYGMQARLAYAYPTIDLLRYQIEEGLKVADEVSFSEADVRTDFEVNPLFDPDKPTVRVTQGVEEWDEGGSGSYSRRSQQNGNTYDVSNGPVRRKNNFSASDPEAQRLQADYWADLVDIMLEKADEGKVGAIAIDGTSDSNTFNSGTGCQIWDSSTNEKPAFFALIGAANRHTMANLVASAPDDSEEALYTAESWKVYAEAKKVAEDLQDVRIYTGDGVEAVKKAITDLQAAIDGLVLSGEQPVLDKTALEAAIKDAEAVKKDEYTEESVKALDEALAAAKKALTDAKTQKQLDDAAKALNDAIAALEKKPEEPVLDKTELEKAIQDAEAVKKDDYTEETVKALDDALAAAKKVLTDAKTQDELDAAAKALNDAIKALEKKPEDPGLKKDELEKAIEDAEKLDADKYTEESAKALAEAIAAAKKALEEAKTQAELDAAKKALDGSQDPGRARRCQEGSGRRDRRSGREDRAHPDPDPDSARLPRCELHRYARRGLLVSRSHRLGDREQDHRRHL